MNNSGPLTNIINKLQSEFTTPESHQNRKRTLRTTIESKFEAKKLFSYFARLATS